MSEYDKKNSELNDADLANVSGAGDGGSKDVNIPMLVREICFNCPQNGQSCQTQLKEYLRENGAYLVTSPESCPFNTSRRGA